MPRRPRCPNCKKYGVSPEKHQRASPSGYKWYRCKVRIFAADIDTDGIRMFSSAPSTLRTYRYDEIQRQVFLLAMYRNFLKDRRRQLEAAEAASAADGESDAQQPQQASSSWKNMMFLCCNENCYNNVYPGYEICYACLEQSSPIVCMEEDLEGSE